MRLHPGDYVSTQGMSKEQYHMICGEFMKAGAQAFEFYTLSHIYEEFDYVGWHSPFGLLHSIGIPSSFKHQLTINQVLGEDYG